MHAKLNILELQELEQTIYAGKYNQEILSYAIDESDSFIAFADSVSILACQEDDEFDSEVASLKTWAYSLKELCIDLLNKL